MALALMPDARLHSRRAVMRGAVWAERGGMAALGRVERRRLLRGMGRGQQTWVGMGLAIYKITRRRAWVIPAFGVSLVYLAYVAVRTAVLGVMQ